MRRCVLHIGWHKTGSTALQHFLHSEAPALADHKVHYPTFHANHSSFLPSAFSTESSESYSEAFVPPHEGYEDLPKREASRILVDEALAFCVEDTVLFSAEDLVLLDRADVLRCYEALASKFDQIELIVYLRDHESYVTSATQQLLRMGFGIAEIIQMAASGTAPIAVLEPLPHYAERLSNWSSIFGRDSLSIFSYNQLVERGESILAHFLQVVVGIDDPAMLARANAWPRTNSSFSHPAAYVLNRVNAISPLFVDGHRNPGFQFNQQRLLADLSGPPFRAPAELFDALRSAHLKDIDRLRALSDITMAPIQERSVFAETATTLFSQDTLLDDVADILSSSGAEALLGNARQKLFASMLGLRSSSSRASAVQQIHLAQFLMADQINLISSANWLISAGELELATNYLLKAEKFSTKPAGLTALQKRLVEAQGSELLRNP